MSEQTTESGQAKKPPRCRWRFHLATLSIPGDGTYAHGCPGCRWYRARGGWAHDDSWGDFYDSLR